MRADVQRTFESCSFLVRGAVVILFFLLMCACLRICISAEEYSYSLDEIGENAACEGWEEMISTLPEDIRSEIDGINPLDSDSSINEIRKKSNVLYWLKRIAGAFLNSTDFIIPTVLPLFSLILLTAAAKSAVGSVASVGMTGTFMMFAKLVVSISVFQMSYSVVELASDYITRLCGIMNMLTPVMEAVYLAGGAVTELSVSTQAVMLFVTLIGNINAYLLYPLTNALFTLSVVSMVCGEAKLGGIVAGLRKLIMRVWQIVSIFFSFMLGVQSIIAKSADSLGSKTVKFALGSFIPVAGSMIAEAFQTVRAGLAFVRSVTGIGGIIIILIILVAGIVPLVLYKLAISVAATSSEMLGLGELSGLMTEIRGITELLLAIVLYSSLMFVLALIIFTKSQVV